MKGMDVVKLIVAIGVCELAGVLGALATTPAIPTWYAALNKPDFRPPEWAFGPVWTALYLMMGIAVFLVWRQDTAQPAIRTALVVFIIQLILNGIWSFLFFGLRSPLLGLIDIVALWVAIVLTIIFFSRVSTAGMVLLLPYLAWVSFAAVLNFQIWRLNPGGP